MVEHAKVPEGQVADAEKGNWVDTYAPGWARPYLRLSRADRPIGTWLLFIPCVWGILLAAVSGGDPSIWDIWLIIGCAMGAFLMRGAGCTWNDITDRKIDAQVARTRSRPIPSGQVNVKNALFWMVLQAVVAFFILLSFGSYTVVVGVLSLGFVAIYPFAKRFTWWPQAFLGLAFNWGALVGWAAHADGLSWVALALYLAGISWTLFYDTIYAYQDVEDDALIGVKSTARLFGNNSHIWLWRFLGATVAIMMGAMFLTDTSLVVQSVFLSFGVFAMGGHLYWQISKLNTQDSELCLKLFRSNRDAGLIPVLFFAIALFL